MRATCRHSLRSTPLLHRILQMAHSTLEVERLQMDRNLCIPSQVPRQLLLVSTIFVSSRQPHKQTPRNHGVQNQSERHLHHQDGEAEAEVEVAAEEEGVVVAALEEHQHTW